MTVKEIQLEQGAIRYREQGAGAPIVFVHGLLANGLLWRQVVPPLARDFRCVVPDWPLGAHDLPLGPNADLSPPGLAKLITDFLEAMRLQDVTLVGNDTGGALCQLVVTTRPERVARLVLTNCDAFDNFPPKMFRPLQWGARLPGFVFLVAQTLRFEALRKQPTAFGLLTKRPLAREISDAYVGPVIRSAAIRREVGRALTAISPRYTLEAAAKLADFRRPVLIVWAPEDRLFPLEHGERLARLFPHARLEKVEDSRTFIPEDQPARLAALIADFMRDVHGFHPSNFVQSVSSVGHFPSQF